MLLLQAVSMCNLTDCLSLDRDVSLFILQHCVLSDTTGTP